MKKAALTLLSFLLLHCAFGQTGPRLHYFYNSGWLAETENYVLVFDFISHAPSGISLNTLVHELEKGSGKNKKVIILVTHDHNDHFDPSVFDIANTKENTSFVLGWNYTTLPAGKNISIVPPRDSLISKDYSIYTHTSTDDGSGFLINIDGYSIYHAGDHALWAEQLTGQFTEELNYIKTKSKKIDLAFLPAARGMFTKCAYDSLIEKGLRLSVEILDPSQIALQHIGCADKLVQYAQIPARLNRTRSKWIVPERYNQDF